MSYILYKSENILPATRVIGGTERGIYTAEIDDALISRLGNDVWYTTVTQEEAESVVWYHQSRILENGVPFRKIKVSGEEDTEGGTGSQIVERTEAEAIAALSLGKKVKKKIAADLYEKKFNALSAGESAADTALWEAQLKEANAYLDDNTVNTPILNILASNRSTTVEELVNKVITANQNFNIKVAEILNEQQIVTDKINSMTDIIDLCQYDPEGLLQPISTGS